MSSTGAQVSRERQQLNLELARIRREAMAASERRDFRAVARLTLEAARVNSAIAASQARDEAVR
jgi:hypothetical protein